MQRQTLTLVLAAVLVMSLGVPTAVAQDGATPTETPTDTPTETPTDTPTGDKQQELTKEQVLAWAQSGKDLTREQAQQVLQWFNQRQTRFDAEERELVQSWLEEQVTGQKSTPSANLKNRTYQFDAEERPDQANTYRSAVQAINDSKVTEGELPDEFKYRGEQVLPGLRLGYEEWRGNQTTLIFKADKKLTLKLNDAWLAGSETDRPAPLYTVDLSKGYAVVQMPTVEDPRNEQYIAVSANGYVETISDPYTPFLERVTKSDLPIAVGGGIVSFILMFLLFASFKSNKYEGKLVHAAEALNMR